MNRESTNVRDWNKLSNRVILELPQGLFWVVTPLILETARRFGSRYRLHFQHRRLRAAAHQLRQDKHQDTRQKRQKLTSASWLRPVCGGFHNLIHLNCAPFFVSCRRHRVLTVTYLDACRCAAYLSQARNQQKQTESVQLLVSCLTYSPILKMELISASETSFCLQITLRYDPKRRYSYVCSARTSVKY
jgi:hypothetical protein